MLIKVTLGGLLSGYWVGAVVRGADQVIGGLELSVPHPSSREGKRGGD